VPSSLVLNGGGIQYTGVGETTGRAFTVGTSGATLDASGAGALVFSGGLGASISGAGSGARTLALGGTSLAGNTLGVVLADLGDSGETSLSKSGVGRWVLDQANTFSGQMSVLGGELVVGANVPATGASPLGDNTLAGYRPLIGGTTADATGTAALLLASGVTLNRQVTVQPLGLGSQSVVLGVVSGTGEFGTQNQLRLGRAVTLQAATGAVAQFSNTWRNSGGTGLPSVDITVGSVGNDGIVRLTTSGTGLYTTGSVSVVAGRFDVASYVQAAGLTVNGIGAELKYNSSTPLSTPLVLAQGMLSGTGAIAVPVTVGVDAILSPGNSPGIQPFLAGLTLGGGGRLEWEINDWTGAAGTNYDQLAVSGSALSVTATSGSPYTIAITSLTGSNTSGAVPGFNGFAGTSFTLATSATGVAGFAPSAFAFDTTAFTTGSSPALPTNAGFWMSQVGDDLVLNYAPSATYDVSVVAGATTIRSGGTTSITATITSSTSGLVNPDALAFSGLAVSNAGGLSVTSGTVLAGGSTGSVGSFTGGVGGLYTLTPSLVGTNVNIGTPANLGLTTSSTVTVWNLAVGSITSGTLVDLGVIHAGGSFGTQSLTIANAAVADGYSEGLNALASGSSGAASFGGSVITNLAAGGSASTLTVGLANADTSIAGVASGSITIGYDSNGSTTSGLPLVSAGSQAVSVVGSVFSGNGIWNVNGGGSWGTGASGNWTSVAGVSAAPGTFAGYANTDSATFGTVLAGGTATVALDGSQVSLASLSFTNTTGRYVIASGTGSGSFSLATPSGKPTVEVAAGLQEIATGIAGTNGLAKTGAGTLVLSGSSGYTGGTDVTAGMLLVNGQIGGNVNVATLAGLGGSGSIAGLLEGAGLVGPGNSPGILTTEGIDPTGGLDFAFEFTGLSPEYSLASASVNDLIRMTGTNPFTADLTSGNVINVYFPETLAAGQTYLGGFFTDLDATSLPEFAGPLKTANFNYYVANPLGTDKVYNGLNFSLLDLSKMQVLVGATTVTSANFASGTVYNGQVTQFVIVPEPAAMGLAAIGIAAAARLFRRRRG
jgi:fibronectin-binding autotransporter adhesin